MHKLNVILDLDQTIISAEEYKRFNFDKLEDKNYSSMTVHIMDRDYVVFGRPHLQEFLDFLFKNFNVSVWTAATKSYALFIIDKFIFCKPKRKLDFIFFSYHCDYSVKCKKGLKGLSILWEKFNLVGYNESNTIIIDDNPEVKSIQQCNCYAIKPFYAMRSSSYKDTALMELMDRLSAIKSKSRLDTCLINNF